MFGNPDGGQANIVFGFKDRLNGESAEAYNNEVNRLIRRINVAIVQGRNPTINREQAEDYVRREMEPGLLQLPSRNFFRMRGTDDIAYEPVDVEGRRTPRGEYLDYLQKVLPTSLLGTEFFNKYQAAFISKIN